MTVKVLFGGVKGHIRFFRGNFFVVLIVDALPKFRVSFEYRSEFAVHGIDLIIKTVRVFVSHAGIDLVDLLLKRLDLFKVGDKRRFFLLG